MIYPRIIIYYEESRVPRKIVYDNGSTEIDLTEIMFISKVGWEFDISRGVPITTLTFDAEMLSEMVSEMK